MVPEIWSVTDRIFYDFGLFLPFYPSNNLKNQNFEKMKKTPGDNIILHMCTKMTIIWCMVWFLRYGAWRTWFFVTLDHFLPFYPSNTKNQNFEKMEKEPGDIIILHMCSKNDNHMIYGSWDIEHNEQNVLSFWTIFCPFTT